MNVLNSLPPVAIFALVVLAVAQIGVEVWAIVDLIKRPKEQIAGGNKVLWVLLILFVNLIGAIVYLVVGRQPAPVDVTPAAPVGDDVTKRAIDSLYGPGGDEQ